MKTIFTSRYPLHAFIAGLLAIGSASAFAQEDRASFPKFERENYVYKVEQGKWTGPKLSDGQPDVQGQWSNTIGNHNNLVNPQGGGNRNNDKPRAPSRVVDPEDGQVPFQAWARELQKDYAKHLLDPTKPEYIEPLARCAPAGPSKSFMWHGYEIRQYPGYVVFLFDSGSRIIHLDKKPHLPENIKLWNGDSRGHWEGNTLIVDVTNNNSKSRFGRNGEFASENAQVAEKFIFDNNRERFTYRATYTDPSVYTRPWTLEIPNRRVEKFAEDGWNNQLGVAKHNGKELLLEPYEQICTENNGGFGGGAVKKTADNTSPKTTLTP
ncbi:hypothetical protein GCM10011613_15800 [Cellvibrio zantedeschiae]|uniref:Uncharacterized protein n=1 Tax=Cellvibrio zantedeschiae TaxID=1237077 RepID=A0ABQ3B006_9GAMM|nr:hypothetical protein [Cellvibrio zantedeschiae]GGY71767.1 hypothetical protein GCM10011613_15800 [Cellvibrio zantedeschiae]